MRTITPDKSKLSSGFMVVYSEMKGRRQRMFFQVSGETQADEILAELEADFRGTLKKHRPEVDFNA